MKATRYAYTDYLDAAARTDADIRSTHKPRGVVDRFANSDAVYRAAEERARRYVPKDEVEQGKIVAAWVDGFLCAMRSHARPGA